MPRRSPNALTTPSGRPAAFGTRVRERIDTTRVVNMMHKHLFSEDENERGCMTANDIQIARILLDRTVPVLKAIETAPETDRDAKTVSNSDLLDFIEGQATRVDRK